MPPSAGPSVSMPRPARSAAAWGYPGHRPEHCPEHRDGTPRSAAAWGYPGHRPEHRPEHCPEHRDGTPRWRRFLRSRVASGTSTATSSLGSSLTITSSSPSLATSAPDDSYAKARRQFATYLQSPSVHGLQYIARGDYPLAVRALWALLFCSSVVGLVALAYLQAFSSKSMTRISVVKTRVPLEEYPFPSVTVCPHQQILKNTALALLRTNNMLQQAGRADNATPDDALYLRMMAALQHFRYPQFSLDWQRLDADALQSLGSMDAREFMMKVFPPCHLIFKLCVWRSVPVDCCAIFDLQETHSGFCYAFNSCTSMHFRDRQCKPRNGSTEEGVGLIVLTHFTIATEVVDDSANTFTVVVGNPYEVPQTADGYRIEGDLSFRMITASLTVQDAERAIERLPWEARKCKFLDEHALGIAKAYAQQTCIEDCRLQLVQARCGCTPHYFSRNYGRHGRADEKACNATGMQCIFTNKASLRRMNSVPVKNKRELDGLRVLDNDTGYDCTCPAECQILMYTTEIANLGTYRGSPVFDDKETSSVLFVHQRNTPASNVVYLKSLHRSFSEFVADLGNIAALFLGASVLSVFEFVFVSASCLKTLYTGLEGSKI